MKGKISKLVSALGLALLVSIPSTVYAKDGDYTIDDIGKTIQPPQYVDTEGNLIEDKMPNVADWKKSVKSQAIGGGGIHKLLFM